MPEVTKAGALYVKAIHLLPAGLPFGERASYMQGCRLVPAAAVHAWIFASHHLVGSFEKS